MEVNSKLPSPCFVLFAPYILYKFHYCFVVYISMIAVDIKMIACCVTAVSKCFMRGSRLRDVYTQHTLQVPLFHRSSEGPSACFHWPACWTSSSFRFLLAGETSENGFGWLITRRGLKNSKNTGRSRLRGALLAWVVRPCSTCQQLVDLGAQEQQVGGSCICAVSGGDPGIGKRIDGGGERADKHWGGEGVFWGEIQPWDPPLRSWFTSVRRLETRADSGRMNVTGHIASSICVCASEEKRTKGQVEDS